MPLTPAKRASAIDLLILQFPLKMRLTTAEIALVLNLHPASIRNQISSKIFPIPTHFEGRNRYADIRDVAEHIESLSGKKKAGRPTKASKMEGLR